MLPDPTVSQAVCHIIRARARVRRDDTEENNSSCDPHIGLDLEAHGFSFSWCGKHFWDDGRVMREGNGVLIMHKVVAL